MSVTGTALVEWEKAEVERSHAQAVRTAAVVRPTSPRILERYVNPPAATPYALEYAFHLLGDVRGRSVLDYGAGDGRDTTLLAHRGANVWALDISPDLLGIAEQRVTVDGHRDAVTILCGSAHAIPLPDESMDVVWGDAVLHHLDLRLTEREVYRVLKPGGRAIFKEPLRDSRVLRAIRPLIPYRQPDVSPFERPLLWREVTTFAQRFRRFDYRCFDLPFVAAARVLGASKERQERLQQLDGQLLRDRPWLNTYATCVVFEVEK